MRIAVTADIAPRSRAALRDRVRLALGSHAQAIRWIEIEGGAHKMRLRARFVDGRQYDLEGWHVDPERALERPLDRLRRSLVRASGSGISPAPFAPPR